MSEKLFTLGPVEMFEYTRSRLLGQLPYFRTREFSEIQLECARRLKRLAGAPEEAHVFLMTCSGTGAMEAVTGGCFGEKDKLLVIDGGGFGHRFAEIAEFHRIPHDCVNLGFGEALTPEALGAIAGTKNFTGMLVNLHETTTGQLYDKDMLASFCRERGLFFIIDAIGSFLADPLDFERDGVDALIISSQKALALPPGLAVVIMSESLYEKTLEQGIKPFSMYFDFQEAEANAVRGQTPFTPAIGTVLALLERLTYLESEGGAKAEVGRVTELAEDFRERVRELVDKDLVSLPAYPLSSACTPLIFANGRAKDVYERLSERHGVWLNPNGGALADTVLRVGHLGDLTKEDNAMLVELLSGILV